MATKKTMATRQAGRVLPGKPVGLPFGQTPLPPVALALRALIGAKAPAAARQLDGQQAGLLFAGGTLIARHTFSPTRLKRMQTPLTPICITGGVEGKGRRCATESGAFAA